MNNGDGPNSDSSFRPDSPKKVEFYQVLILFFYHIALAVFLAYAIYNVWPPQPWPGDSPKKDGVSSSAPTASPTSITSPAQTSNGTRAPSPEAIAPSANVPANSQSNANSNSNSTAASTASRAGSNTPSPQQSPTPAAEITSPYGNKFPPPFTLFFWQFQPPLETRLILLVLLVGAIGSYVHAASSLVDYLGNRTLISSWVWWYLLRPLIGMMLALIFYFGFRGGFVTAGVNPATDSAANFINPFGIAAMAGLVGMFSKVATDKLNEVFLTLFRPAANQGDAKRGDKLTDSFTPNIFSLGPNTGPAAGGTVVTITGTGFIAGARVIFGGVASPLVNVASATSLTASTPPHAAGVVEVEVVNPNNQKVTLKEGFTYTN